LTTLLLVIVKKVTQFETIEQQIMVAEILILPMSDSQRSGLPTATAKDSFGACDSISRASVRWGEEQSNASRLSIPVYIVWFMRSCLCRNWPCHHARRREIQKG
jgi:hypothetical protein